MKNINVHKSYTRFKLIKITTCICPCGVSEICNATTGPLCTKRQGETKPKTHIHTPQSLTPSSLPPSVPPPSVKSQVSDSFKRGAAGGETKRAPRPRPTKLCRWTKKRAPTISFYDLRQLPEKIQLPPPPPLQFEYIYV